MKVRKLLLSTAVLTVACASVSSAQSAGPYVITTDLDRTGDNGLFIYWDDEPWETGMRLIASITEGGTAVSGDLSLEGVLYNSITSTVTVQDSLAVNGNMNVNGDVVVLSSGSTRAFETRVLDLEGNVTNEVDIRAKFAGEWDPVTNPDGAELADITLDADDDVNIRTGDDLEVDSQSKIQLDAVDDIELDTGNNVDVLAANDIGMTATRILGTTGNATSIMQSGSIVNTVTASGGVSAGTVVANNGSPRWVADAKGKLTQVTNTDTTSGTTASMVVQNSAGNIHGLVVQETKTTLSGGINSASLTLDDRGATFSDPANGNPIQVHGVADGTAPFDAVNVRQLYSGLASVLATAPDIRLEPGKSGFGIGVGSYGGYQAVGFGFGHMYGNGAVLSGSVARGSHSETAARASLSWTW